VSDDTPDDVKTIQTVLQWMLGLRVQAIVDDEQRKRAKVSE
jgi:hypothetical protein